MFYQDAFEIGLELWYIGCSVCGDICGPYSEEEKTEYEQLGGVADWLCFKCWDCADLVEPSILQSQKDDIYTFREDQPETWTQKGTYTGFTDLVIQPVKYISIKVTDGLPF